MKVYVASSFLRKDSVREMHALLRRAGHEITCDWTGEDATGMSGAVLWRYMERAAMMDRDGVIAADVVIVLHDDRGRAMHAEMGMAVALGKPVIVVGGKTPADEIMRSVFYYLPATVIHVESPAAAMLALPKL